MYFVCSWGGGRYVTLRWGVPREFEGGGEEEWVSQGEKESEPFCFM